MLCQALSRVFDGHSFEFLNCKRQAEEACGTRSIGRQSGLGYDSIRIDPQSSAASSTTPAPCSKPRSPSPSSTRTARPCASARSAAAGATTAWSSASSAPRCRPPASPSACRACRRRSPPQQGQARRLRRPRRRARHGEGPTSPTTRRWRRRCAHAGIRAEMYLGTAGMKAQMKYADKRGAPCVVIQGGDERCRGRGADQGPDRRRQGRRHHQGQQGVARRPPGAGLGARGRPGRPPCATCWRGTRAEPMRASVIPAAARPAPQSSGTESRDAEAAAVRPLGPGTRLDRVPG